MGDYIPAQDGTIIRDFMARTLHNLELIEAHAPAPGETAAPSVYEVTQLINSMLGLLIFPREEFWTHFVIKNPNELPADFPALRYQRSLPMRDDETTEFQALIRLIRNSFAHFGVETNTRTGEIEALVLTNRNKKGHATWQMRISVNELRAFVKWFAHGIMDSTLLDRSIESIQVA